MIFHRMISWADLSDVQLEEEELFQKAYKEIDNVLNG